MCLHEGNGFTNRSVWKRSGRKSKVSSTSLEAILPSSPLSELARGGGRATGLKHQQHFNDFIETCTTQRGTRRKGACMARNVNTKQEYPFSATRTCGSDAVQRVRCSFPGFASLLSFPTALADGLARSVQTTESQPLVRGREGSKR